ncbi:MAG: SLBB domain-containing protein [Deltaproteobacteria bacterium]|jgi:NADH-quinone oxidoreductase subunit F|nr:SLBB domain-containing protein [Deltaproteobacteria bacterium]MBW2530923.1 SLBB domain-containing protein [Deltaproteobacteria bacterium]
MQIQDAQAFDKAVSRAKRAHPAKTPRLLVCGGTGCMARGSLKVADALRRELADQKVKATVSMAVTTTGCHGFCEIGPLVILEPRGLLYSKVKPADAKGIVAKTVANGEVIQKLLYKDPDSKKRIERYREIGFYKHQQWVALRNVGLIDPESIDEFMARGGYRAAVKALTQMTPDEVITAVEKSKLRGRGGGGFATGRKWRSCIRAEGDVRYILCNGDEGDPGAFMDCSIMEGDPHSVLEGMIIGAYAIGAHQGWLYVREEYPKAQQRLRDAIAQAEAYGLLGDDILGTGFSLRLAVARGAGAFVCGESSALMRSVAGEIGEPRAKYVRSVEKGLFDQPTVLNNVETYACVPPIIDEGSDWFAKIGTEKSGGTKAFCLVGKVRNTGLIEVPLGTTLRQIVFDIGGGMQKNRHFKAVQTGGPSGGCLPEALLDEPVDFDTLTAKGSMMGSGGMIVMDERTCMVDVARYFLKFLMEESCGKCVPCREGVRQLCDLLTLICEGKADMAVLDRVEALSKVIQDASLCGLGKSAPNPVVATLQYFRDEYETHIRDHKCPAGVCKELVTFQVIPDLCTGCVICKRVCAFDAVEGKKKEIHVIDQEKCTRCGACYTACTFDAIEAV